MLPEEYWIYGNVFFAIFRYLAPAMALVLVLRCAKSLLTFPREPEIWGHLQMAGQSFPITHWETVLGRSRRCDVVIAEKCLARNHAVVTRYDDGSWSITDLGAREGILVNSESMESEDTQPLLPGDKLTLGSTVLTFTPSTAKQEAQAAQERPRAMGGFASIANLLLLTAFQCLTLLGFWFSQPEWLATWVMSFGGLMVLQWALLFFYVCIRRTAFEVELLAFFLCTLGMATVCTVRPEEAFKQLIAVTLGILSFLSLGWSVRKLGRARIIRYGMAVLGMGLLVATLVFGKEIHGAKNWIIISGISLQPSELAKVCFVYVGASTMDRLLQKRNLVLFIFYTVALCGLLAIMNDFGTALIFFITFLVIAFLRSGSVGTVALAVTALGFAGVIGLKIAPHALGRFQTWRHIWQDPYGKGYQQTQALMCMAAGGLFGLGIGNGRMERIFAADSDVVVATLAEEWGLVMVLLAVVCLAVLALFSLRCAGTSRSSFYAIGSCTAASILVVQAIFNALGTVDILPLTGVTFPFLSNGGSSMIAAWCLLAFIKGADTRKQGSFAVSIFGKRRR